MVEVSAGVAVERIDVLVVTDAVAIVVVVSVVAISVAVGVEAVVIGVGRAAGDRAVVAVVVVEVSAGVGIERVHVLVVIDAVAIVVVVAGVAVPIAVGVGPVVAGVGRPFGHRAVVAPVPVPVRAHLRVERVVVVAIDHRVPVVVPVNAVRLPVAVRVGEALVGVAVAVLVHPVARLVRARQDARVRVVAVAGALLHAVVVVVRALVHQQAEVDVPSRSHEGDAVVGQVGSARHGPDGVRGRRPVVAEHADDGEDLRAGGQLDGLVDHHPVPAHGREVPVAGPERLPGGVFGGHRVQRGLVGHALGSRPDAQRVRRAVRRDGEPHRRVVGAPGPAARVDEGVVGDPVALQHRPGHRDRHLGAAVGDVRKLDAARLAGVAAGGGRRVVGQGPDPRAPRERVAAVAAVDVALEVTLAVGLDEPDAGVRLVVVDDVLPREQRGLPVVDVPDQQTLPGDPGVRADPLPVLDEEVLEVLERVDPDPDRAAPAAHGSERCVPAGVRHLRRGLPAELDTRPGRREGRAVGRQPVACAHEAPVADPARRVVGVVQVREHEDVPLLVAERADGADVPRGDAELGHVQVELLADEEVAADEDTVELDGHGQAPLVGPELAVRAVHPALGDHDDLVHPAVAVRVVLREVDLVVGGPAGVLDEALDVLRVVAEALLPVHVPGVAVIDRHPVGDVLGAGGKPEAAPADGVVVVPDAHAVGRGQARRGGVQALCPEQRAELLSRVGLLGHPAGVAVREAGEERDGAGGATVAPAQRVVAQKPGAAPVVRSANAWPAGAVLAVGPQQRRLTEPGLEAGCDRVAASGDQTGRDQAAGPQRGVVPLRAVGCVEAGQRVAGGIDEPEVPLVAEVADGQRGAVGLAKRDGVGGALVRAGW